MRIIYLASALNFLTISILDASNSSHTLIDLEGSEVSIGAIPLSPVISGQRKMKIINEEHDNFEARDTTLIKEEIDAPILNLDQLHRYDELKNDFPKAHAKGYFSFSSFEGAPQTIALCMIKSLTNPNDSVVIQKSSGEVTMNYKGFMNNPAFPMARIFTNMEAFPFASTEPFQLDIYTPGSGGKRRTEIKTARELCEGTNHNRVVIVIDPYEKNIGSRQFDASAPTPLLNVLSFINGLYDQGKLRYPISKINWISSSVSGMSSMGLAPSMTLYKRLSSAAYPDLPKDIFPINEIHAVHMPAVLQLSDADLVSTGSRLVFYIGKNDEWINQQATVHYAERLKKLGHDVRVISFDAGHDFETLDYTEIKSNSGLRMDDICNILTLSLKEIAKLEIPKDGHEANKWMSSVNIAKMVGQSKDDGTHVHLSILNWIMMVQTRTKKGIKGEANAEEREKLMSHLLKIGDPT
ncbi:MAG: hypothetical protein K2X98_03640 [Alphaproteobacteria bacterium]|nr:hypothetical protein [Alphaproteobacteria bacterium]